MKTGIPGEVWNEISDVFENFSKITQVILFGSRAMGNFREGSDIDLAVKGENLALNDLLDIEAALEDLQLLYNFDLVNFLQITNTALKDHINRVGKVVYTKKIPNSESSPPSISKHYNNK
ncbi:nucleotidyltransferase domain-containing protein [Cyclobacterium sp.]|uniref:nucleotidyltransferase domain-containing protein n=1 Tax=Cyclobacterium sp. TaxID=1966343 RepID=UPI0019AF15AC|nr:nucleotidyltransferase domain-containing protein [Cyclobacterium sp.]MBD3627788.1 nucleotidyltransferase domain-containing protein [Cyclobacterium sp.]